MKRSKHAVACSSLMVILGSSAAMLTVQGLTYPATTVSLQRRGEQAEEKKEKRAEKPAEGGRI